MITKDTISSHEFIGQRVSIDNSTNSQIIGLNGVIIDETKSMITLNTRNGIKKLPKSNNTWKFTLSDGEKEIPGKIITKRPEDRLRVKA